MQWCECLGQVLWASLMIPISLPLLLLLLLVASICGLIGEFLLWLFPTHIFSNELVEMGNNLASTSRKIFYWCLLKDSDVGLWNKNRHVRNEASSVLQSTQTLVEHVINMTQQPVPLASRLPFTVPRSTIIYGFPKIGFTYQELAAATNGFSESNVIGEGGFGKVYKGKLQGGRHAAIKEITSPGFHGEEGFFKELDFLSRVHHRHLVQLIGCCVTEGKSLLVYEFVPKGALDTYLYGNGAKTIDWPTRVKVALGCAKALAYLHEGCQPRIIHRDFKSANILLHNNFQPKVSDFGLGTSIPDDVTHIETRVMGTHGYAAPEYLATGALSEKCDVYSYGVVLLQLISGRRSCTPGCEPFFLIDYINVVRLMFSFSSLDVVLLSFDYMLLGFSRFDNIEPKVRLALQNNDFSEIVDPRLMNQYNHDEMRMMIACATACTHYSPHERPPISRIALVLGGRLPPETLGSLDNHSLT